MLHVRDNTGVSLTWNRSSAFISEIIWIKKGIVIVLIGNPYWKLFDQADPYALLKVHAFICHFVYLQSTIFIVRFGFHSEFGLYIPNNLNYFISHSPINLLLTSLLMSCNSMYFPLAPTLVRFIWAMLSPRNFKFLYRLCWGLFPHSERKIILILDAFTEATSTVSKSGRVWLIWFTTKKGIFSPSVIDVFTAGIPARYQGRC